MPSLASTEILIEQYEQRMRMDATRSSAMSSFLSPLGALSDITSGIETVINENPIIKNNIPKKPMSGSTDPQQMLNADKNTCEEEEFEEGLIPKLDWGIEEKKQEKTYLDMGVMLSPEEAQNLEDCWNCDLKAEFDWEVKPVNFLAEIDELMNDIEDAIDHVIDATNPHNLLAELCPLFNLDSEFSWMCAPDIMAMLQGIQLVLSRYLNESLNFTLNWTSVIGPLIKFVADSLSMCMENIRNIILAPINCINSVLKTVSQIQDEFNELAGTVGTLGTALDPRNSSLAQLFEKENYSENRKPGVESITKDNKAGSYFTSPGDVGFTRDGGNISTGLTFNYNANLNDLLKENKRNSQGLFKLGGEKFTNQKWAPNAIVPTLKDAGGWVGDVDRFLRTDDKGKPVNLLQKIILTLNSAENIINNLFANLIFTIKSLNKMIVGNLSFNIKISGIILFLIDLINLCYIWLEIIKNQGPNAFQNLCKEMSDGEGEMYDKVKHPWFSEKTISTVENRDKSLGKNNTDDNCGITEE